LLDEEFGSRTGERCHYKHRPDFITSLRQSSNGQLRRVFYTPFMKVRWAVLACALAFPASNYAQARNDCQWEAYKPRTLQSIIDLHRGDIKRLNSKRAVLLTGDSFQSQAKLVYSGKTRPLQAEHGVLMDFWRKMLKDQAPSADEFATEVLFKEGASERWIVVQKPLLDPLFKEVKNGQTINSYVIWIGAIRVGEHWEWLFAMNRFDPQ
jgi:hypothetical protein